MTIIGRKAEQELLKQCLDSKKSEFLAIYGRRRVGKTFLVKEAFANQFFFYATGILDENKSLSIQLENFNDELADQGGSEFARAQDWQEAFRNLNRLVEQTPGNAKKVIFLDEIPWMATQNSGFLAALDHFWNRWASSRNDVLLIICGSATSWIIDNVINNRGGLHNRLTRQIQLAPFTLSECEEFFDSNGFVMTHYQIAEAYMIFGGVPYYLSLMNPRQDLNQIVDDVYFRAGAPLQNEFGNLFRSLFRNPSNHVAVVEALASKAKGLKRNEIVEQTGLSDGGGLTRVLEDLEQCGFIRVYRAFGKALQGKTYQLTDAFVLFHLRFSDKRERYSGNYWQQFSSTPGHSSWSGYAFEQVCLLHAENIKKKLGIAGVLTEVSSWRSASSEPGAQVDLVIDRADNVINLCEIKYAKGEYSVTKEDYLSLHNKMSAFSAETRTRKALRVTLVTTFGVRPNKYSAEFNSQVTLDDLFAPL